MKLFKKKEKKDEESSCVGATYLVVLLFPLRVS